MARHFRAVSGWAILLPSLLGGLVLPVVLLLVQRGSLPLLQKVNASTIEPPSEVGVANSASVPATPVEPAQEPQPTQMEELNRYQLTYQQWVAQLGREATAIAHQSPPQLHILAGDSLSLWFPVDQLPPNATWLNQGISGETSMGLLRRLKLFDQTQPRIIFVMIGINDLIRGVSDETVVANHREIVRHLRKAHPAARIIVQSILPHGSDRAIQRYIASTVDNAALQANSRPLWVDRLPTIPNDSIRALNDRLEIIAREEKVEYVDLHPLFMDENGDLQAALTTDGLHLSPRGYAVWRSQLELFAQSPPKSTFNRVNRFQEKGKGLHKPQSF